MSDNILIIQGSEEKRQSIHYEVDGDQPVLGEGNFGAVRKGVMVDELTGNSRDVAIKFLFSDLSAQGVERSRREAAIRIKNDNLVEMIDFVQMVTVDANGNKSVRNHVVSELLQGVMLLSLMKDGRITDREGNEIPRAQNLLELYQTDSVRFACEVVSELLLGVKALHENGYIHRDIDPSNIMITMDGRIKLIDLGVAKDISATAKPGAAHLTNVGDFVGKHAYAAPELILGDVNSQNPTTDLYAVGIMLFQLVTGKLPFKGSIHEITQQHLSTPVPVDMVPNSDLRAIIKKATAKEQSNRYSSAEEFRQALTRVRLDGPEKPGKGVDKDAMKKWAKIAGIGLAGMAVAALLILIVPKLFGGSDNGEVSNTAENTYAQQTTAAPNNVVASGAGQDTPSNRNQQTKPEDEPNVKDTEGASDVNNTDGAADVKNTDNGVDKIVEEANKVDEAAKKKAEEAAKKAEEVAKKKAEEAAKKAEEAAAKKAEAAAKKAEEAARKKAEAEAKSAGPKVPYGTYSGPANGTGGEIRVTRAYSLNLRKSNGESVYLQPGDIIYNTIFRNGELKQGIWKHNGISQLIMR